MNCIGMRNRFLIYILLCVAGAAGAQVFSTDSTRIAAYYNGSGHDIYEVRDTINDTIITNYITLLTPYHNYFYTDTVEHLSNRKLIGSWQPDTVVPKLYWYRFRLEGKGRFVYFDSTTYYDTVLQESVRYQREMYGKWKIVDDTLFTVIHGCRKPRDSSWRIDAGGWRTYVMANGMLCDYSAEEGILVKWGTRMRKAR